MYILFGETLKIVLGLERVIHAFTVLGEMLIVMDRGDRVSASGRHPQLINRRLHTILHHTTCIPCMPDPKEKHLPDRGCAAYSKEMIISYNLQLSK